MLQTRLKRAALLAVIVSFAAAAGCDGGPSIAPVSGTIYMDGKPLPNVDIAFQPIGSEQNPNPGRGSTAKTDAEGRYALKIDGTVDGAVVGRHRIVISSSQTTAVDPETGSADGAPVEREMVPPEYNYQSKLEFEVPAGGTNNADFQLDSFETLRKKQPG
jgi:hypothetical protein